MGKYLYIIKKAISNLFGNRLNYYQECYYNRITNQYKSANNYLALYKKCVIDNSIKTATEIFFSAELKFNCSIKDVKKKLHAPNYHIRTFSNTNTEILIYRTLTGQYKVKYQLHFFEGKLFLFNYTFSNIKKEEEVAIIAIL
ncbi:MAG: hypothetical protein NTX03_06040, partial [Bacteroidetes bacterium]|nr:hypothetical protein [Bacteroidota bacterium]